MLKKILITIILVILSIIIYISTINDYAYDNNTLNNLSPLIVNSGQINEKTNKIKIDKNEINITLEEINDKIKGFSVEEVIESNQTYLYPVSISNAGKGGVLKLKKVDFQNFFFSNINNVDILKEKFEEALNIKLNVSQTIDINQNININSDSYININTYIAYKVFNIKLSKRGLFNKDIVINCNIAIASDIVFDTKEYSINYFAYI